VSIPIADPGRWYRAHAQDVAAAQAAVIDSGRFILGPEVQAFEAEFAAFCDAPHAVAVGSGTDALTLSLMALDVAGGEVITSAHTAIATVAAIERAGAVPVLADIDPRTRCLHPGAVESLLGPATRAVVAVHLYGHPAAVDELSALVAGSGVALVEDCAQAHGARTGGRPVGALAAAGAFSFYPTKNLGAMGDAGAVVTADAGLADRVRRLRQYGWDGEGISRVSGINSRMDDLQAAVLRLKLALLGDSVLRRRQIARRYTGVLAGNPDITAPAEVGDIEHAYHLYVVECAARDDLEAFLAGRNIGARRYYEQPCYRHPAYAGLGRSASMENLEAIQGSLLALPVFAELTEAEVDTVCAALAEWRV